MQNTFQVLLDRASISARELEMHTKHSWWKFLSEEEKQIIRSVEWEKPPPKPPSPFEEILVHLAKVIL